MSSDTDAERTGFSFSFTVPRPSQSTQSPQPPQARSASSSSPFIFSQSTSSPANPLHADGLTPSASPPTPSFSSPSSSTFASSSILPSFNTLANTRRLQSPETPSGCSSRILTPTSSHASSASTTRALFTALDIDADSPQASYGASLSNGENLRTPVRSDHLTVSTYRDLYNVTPSPQPSSSREESHSRNLEASSPSSSRLGSVTTGVRDLGLQSAEPPSFERGDNDETDTESEFSSGYDSDDEVSTYDVREEELPRAPIYDTRLQTVLRTVRGHLADLASDMRRSVIVRDETTDINDLYQQVESASRFEYPESRIVGFIGDSGVGKSTLINCLLDHAGLARSSGNGTACTSVVTEFRHVNETYQHPYTIVADFMNTEEIKELLGELVRDYRKCHTEVFHEVREQQEAERIRLLSERAWGTLRSLFPNEAALTEEFLSSEDLHAEEEIIARLEAWASAGLVYRPGGPGALQYTVEARDMVSCRENIDVLTVASRDPERPALWPFVKLIRVYLRSPTLRTGLVVADLPGLRDLNYARLRATERYMRDVCHEVFVVSIINRCRSDPSIREILERLPSSQPIRIVCTRSEADLDAEESMRDPEMSVRVGTEARRLLDQIRQAKATAEAMRGRRRRSSGARQGDYATREAEAWERKEQLDYELQELLISARNGLAVADLLSSYRNNTKIFCVSSRLYMDHRGASRGRATEYIRLSCIPELRQYCQLVPAQAQLRATSAFLGAQVPSYLRSLNQWVLAGSNAVTMERAETLRRVLDEAQRTLQTRLISRNSCIRVIKADLETQLSTVLIRRARGCHERWKTSAIRASQDWATLYHSSYAAFCRKYGAHQPTGGHLRYWNNELLADTSDELDEGWSTLLTWLDQQQNISEEQIDNLFDSVSTSIGDYTHLAPEALENLLDNLDIQQRLISGIIQSSFEDLRVQTMRIKRDSLDGQSSSSYIAEIMRPAYNMCNAESGKGSDARRKNHMDQHVRYSEIFPKLSDSIKAAYMDVLNNVFARLGRKLEEEVRNITRDLGVVIAVEGEVTEAERDPELAQRVRSGVAEVQAHLDEANSVLRQLNNDSTRED